MFDKLKKLFVVSDEEFAKNESKSHDRTITKESNNAPNQSGPDTPSVNATHNVKIDMQESASIDKLDPKFMDILLGAIESKNQQGFDYLEFKQSLQNLSGIAMDEATKYSSAMAMAKTMGADPNSIAQSAQFYLEVLQAEETKFANAIQSQTTKVNEGLLQSIKQKENLLLQKQQQIDQLKKEILNLENEISDSKKEMQESAGKIENAKQQFLMAYRMIVDQITSDVANINKYIK